MREQTRRPFIVFSFSTTFPRLLVNQSFIPGVGTPCMALTNMHSDLRFNPSFVPRPRLAFRWFHWVIPTLSIPTSSISIWSTFHFVNSHFVNSHLANVDKAGIDKVGIDEVGIDKVGIDKVGRYCFITRVLYFAYWDVIVPMKLENITHIISMLVWDLWFTITTLVLGLRPWSWVVIDLTPRHYTYAYICVYIYIYIYIYTP